jgi:hypothetical protein
MAGLCNDSDEPLGSITTRTLLANYIFLEDSGINLDSQVKSVSQLAN